MKHLSLAAVALALCICSLSFAEDAAAPAGMGGTAKITKAPAFETKPAMIAATAFVKAADFAPEGGWGDKDFEPAINSMVQNGTMRVAAYMQEKNITPVGPMFAVWYEDPMVTPASKWTSKWGMPIPADNEPTALVTIERMPETFAATITYQSHPNASMNAWSDIMKFIEASEFTYAGAPMEVYHKWSETSKNNEDWLVEIVWPVMKKPAGEAPAEEQKH